MMVVKTSVLSFWILILLGNSVESQEESKPKAIICYYDSTAYWRTGIGRFQASDIDPSICSHVVYSFLGVKEATGRIYSRDPGLDLGPGEIELDPDDEINNRGDLDMIRKTVKVKEDTNSNVKILISVGGPQQSSESFTLMAQDVGKRAQFVQSTVDYVQKFNLDGIDIYWQFPAGGDKLNLVLVVKELKDALVLLSSVSGKEYTLTAAVGCTKTVIDEAYDVLQLSEYLDFFHLLCFDFNMYSNESETSEKIKHHSPLFQKDSDSLPNQQLTVAFGVNYFLQLGAPAEKLILGVAAHARTYLLQTPQENNFDDTAKGPGSPGQFTFREGFLAYFEICHMIKSEITGWLFRYDNNYRIPYVSNNQLWIGYENELSVQEKVDFAVDKNLGGLMAQFIDLDDSKNTCEAWYSFPIISSIKERLAFWGNNYSFEHKIARH